MQLLFGTGGSPHSSMTASSVDGIRRIAELGLGCMELEFVQGVRMSEGTARQVREVAGSLGVELTAHAPYFINLNAAEPEKVAASQNRIWQTAHIGALCGARSVVLHPAFYLKSSPEQTYETVKIHLGQVVDRLRQAGNRIWIRLEVMGRPSQFGTIEETLRMSREMDRVAPCVDFAHWHARTGASNSYEEFVAILSQVKETLGQSALEEMHIHLSGINYGKSGERKHLDLVESDFRYEELLRALRDCGVGGYVICESPNLEEDALLLKSTYEANSSGFQAQRRGG